MVRRVGSSRVGGGSRRRGSRSNGLLAWLLASRVKDTTRTMTSVQHVLMLLLIAACVAVAAGEAEEELTWDSATLTSRRVWKNLPVW